MHQILSDSLVVYKYGLPYSAYLIEHFSCKFKRLSFLSAKKTAPNRIHENSPHNLDQEIAEQNRIIPSAQIAHVQNKPFHTTTARAIRKHQDCRNVFILHFRPLVSETAEIERWPRCVCINNLYRMSPISSARIGFVKIPEGSCTKRPLLNHGLLQ